MEVTKVNHQSMVVEDLTSTNRRKSAISSLSFSDNLKGYETYVEERTKRGELTFQFGKPTMLNRQWMKLLSKMD